MAVFGPLFSRRFGMSLGIDVVGSKDRECDFDCLYCELKATKKVSSISQPEDPRVLIEATKKIIASGVKIDVLTVTANGEPTLYERLDELIDGLNEIKTTQKTLILSNGGSICNTKIQNALSKFDIVKLSLDSALENSYKKIDRPLTIDLAKRIECMADFSKTHGALILETLFVKNVNDSAEDIQALKEAYAKILPLRIDISTIDRPPAYQVAPVDELMLYQIAEEIGFANICVALRKNAPKCNKSFSRQEWILTTSKRPLTLSDAKFLADTESFELFLKLIESDTLKKRTVAGVDFYTQHAQ